MQGTTVSLDKLQQLKAELESWRSRQTGRRRIPKHLWEKAFELLKTYPVGTLSRQLRLDYNKLRKHLLSSNPARKSKFPQFLELSARELVSCASPRTDSDSTILPQATMSCRILIERVDGSRLTVHLSQDWSKIEAICNGFLRG